MKVYNSELTVLEVLWSAGPLPAKQVSVILQERIGWNKNTTYTVLKKLVEKGLVQRTEPDFQCTALITRKDVQKEALSEMLGKIFHNSRKLVIAELLSEDPLTEQEAQELHQLIEHARRSGE